jgi:hypothetical protein
VKATWGQITPEDIAYLKFCDYMAEIYGPAWAERVRLKDVALDKMDLDELEKRNVATAKSHSGIAP